MLNDDERRVLTMEDLRANLNTRIKRLYSGLYRIKPKGGKQIGFRPNMVQAQLFRDMWHRNLVLKDRQRGVTTLCCLMALDQAIFNSDQDCSFVAETQKKANEIYDDKVRYAFDRLPPDVKAHAKARVDRAGQLKFANGSKITVSTDPRGGTLQFLHVSELGKLAAMYPAKAAEVRSGALPAVPLGTGMVWFESTAEGQSGYFYELCKEARDREDAGHPLHEKAFKFHFSSWHTSPENRMDPATVFVPGRLKKYFKELRESHGITLDDWQRAWYAATEKEQEEYMFREYPSTPDEAFQGSIEGAYLAKEMRWLRKEGRIDDLDPIRGYPVHAVADIGYSDSTAIWFFQFVGNFIHVIDFYESSGQGLNYYADMFREKAAQREWSYGTFYWPHDIEVHDISNKDGLSRREVLLQMGIKPIKVVPKPSSFANSLQKARDVVVRCKFDRTHCEEGVVHLDGWTKKWDQKHGKHLDEEARNEHTHAASALRYLGWVAEKEFGRRAPTRRRRGPARNRAASYSST